MSLSTSIFVTARFAVRTPDQLTRPIYSRGMPPNWVSGQYKVKQFNLPATRHSKCFCSTCGSALPMIQMNGRLPVVPAGSLDSKLHMRPDAHIFISSKACWEEALDQVPRVDRLPS